jgi:hypothetical protein
LNDILGFIRTYDKKEGQLIVLPQFNDLYKPIENMFREILPILKPDFFPQYVKNLWVDSDEYILPEVKTMLDKKKQIQEEFNEKINEVDVKINNTKEEFKFLTNILTSTGVGDELVDNLKKTLEYIGYKNVISADDVIEGNRQEDLRILDDGRITVIEIKGHKGNPNEDDCQAVLKYVSRNMRALGRVDIHGILIVNHHRLEPPLERPYPAFTDQQIKDAEAESYTLVSTWELYKAVRLFQEGLINFKDIDIGLHTKGLYTSLSEPWYHIGDIQHRFKDNTIACVYLATGIVNKGDELIVENGNDYFKVVVDEMKINNKMVTTASKGDQLAINIGRPIIKQANIYVKNQK